jgi:hypothetical protein
MFSLEEYITDNYEVNRWIPFVIASIEDDEYDMFLNIN